MFALKYFLLAGAVATGLSSCATADFDNGLGGGRPYTPRVTMPVDLDRDELSLIGEVEQSLEQSGLRPTDRPGVDYQLAFSVEVGPINADVTLTLFQGRERVARGYARSGGPRMLFQRQRVIREAFDRALRQFESQLPRTNLPRQDATGYADPYRPNRPDPRGYERPDAFRQPDPYGQPVPYDQPGQGYGY